MSDVNVLVLTGYGLNCDLETAYAFELAGAKARRVHINSLIDGSIKLADFQILVFIGGFGWGDDHGAGVIQAVRMKTNIGRQLIEFIDGSTNLVKPSFNVEALPDLNQNDLNTVIVRCDVARVEVIDPIEVFVPIAWNVYDFVEPTETVPGYWRVSREERAKFVTLQVDDVDADLRTVLRRNIGIRDAPAPMDNPACGSVVAVTLDGVLTVPFFQGEPGYDALDEESAASVGGRYEFRVSVQ